MTIVPVIMCGGSGTRMWPASRESLPKQFIPLFGTRSTFQNAALMLNRRDVFDRLVVISNQDYRFLVAEQLSEVGVDAEIVLEPMRRDSGAAVAVAAEIAFQRAPGTLVAVMAADHVVEKREDLVALCREAGVAAADTGRIVTLGIKPTHPATGYGYVRAGAPIAAGAAVRELEAFVEKPDAATAERYIADGYLWNSGNFIFRADVMRDEIARFEPMIGDAAARAVAQATRDLGFMVLDKTAFESTPKKSIDYAVMERTKTAAVIEADIGWSDVGTWAAVHDLAERDSDSNFIRGHGVVMNATNVHVRSDEHLTTVLGVSNVVVINTGDAVLVVDHRQAGAVKDMVEELKARKRPEAVEHRRAYRPWGYYQSIDMGARYQVKRIVVTPGGRLSLQKHYHRAEHWIVVKGTAEVTVNDTIKLVHENESIYLPIGSVHRMANPGKIDLELIEVQTGSYLGEDDIIRIEDIYNRG